MVTNLQCNQKFNHSIFEPFCLAILSVFPILSKVCMENSDNSPTRDDSEIEDPEIEDPEIDNSGNDVSGNDTSGNHFRMRLLRK